MSMICLLLYWLYLLSSMTWDLLLTMTNSQMMRQVRSSSLKTGLFVNYVKKQACLWDLLFVFVFFSFFLDRWSVEGCCWIATSWGTVVLSRIDWSWNSETQLPSRHHSFYLCLGVGGVSGVCEQMVLESDLMGFCLCHVLYVFSWQQNFNFWELLFSHWQNGKYVMAVFREVKLKLCFITLVNKRHKAIIIIR